MGERLSTQLETLHRERERLEELLMLDASWRALRQLDQRERAGAPLQAKDGGDLRASLVAALSSNRIYAARAKLIETIELLSSLPADGAEPRVRPSGTVAGPEPVSSRIVLLDQPATGDVRARPRLPPAADGPPAAPEPWRALAIVPEPAAPAAVPDALELIDGLGRQAVELLLAHDIRSFEAIALWTPADAAAWRARLDGIADGLPSAWIEQAALLSTGRETQYAARVRRGEFTCLVPAPAPEPARRAAAVTGTAVPVAPASQPSPVEARPEAPPVAAGPAPPVPIPVVAADGHGEDKLPLMSRLSLRRRGFSRPVVPTQVEVEPSEVLVVSPPEGSELRPAHQSASPTTHPDRLVRRLKQLEGEDRFIASGYAAYRDEVEEASVTIVAPDPQRAPGQSAAGPASPGASRGHNRPVSRFLRALTGRS